MSDKPPTDVRVQVSKNGPYRVSGNLPLGEEIIGADSEGNSVAWRQGRTFPRQQQYALCRCGHSSHKPFCDGSHAKVGFEGPRPRAARLTASRRKSSGARR